MPNDDALHQGTPSGATEATGANEVNEADEAARVRAFYDSIVAYEWSRLDHYVLEFATVRHYLTRYLPPPPCRIIDIGGGPGRYAVLLAQQGYEVTLVDLAPENVAWANARFQEANLPASAALGDARSLGQYAAGTFDAALLLGPLYHLSDLGDRRQALREVHRLLRPHGRAFTMMLTKAAAIYEGFNRWPEGILNRDGVRRLLRTGNGFNFEQNPHDFEGACFTDAAEVRPLHEALGFRTFALAGCESMLGGRRAAVERLAPDIQQAWIQLVLDTCEDVYLLDASERLLYVGEAV